MRFSECLQSYMSEVGCTASELAEASGVTKPTLSRYLSGKRAPTPKGDAPIRLAAGLAHLAAERGIEGFDEHAALEALVKTAGSAEEHALFPERLGLVLDTFGVARNRLARSMDFDPSYISRILSGQRRPADLPAFIDAVASYIARNYGDAVGVALAADLTGEPIESLNTPHALSDSIKRYLSTGDDGVQAKRPAVSSFLEKLDDFDLNEFLKDIHFNEMKVPTAPFQLPTVKTYTGIEEMKQAELDFLKAAVLSKSNDDVILYSDMPLVEMAEDKEFPKKIMGGMALLIRKGIHLQNIHDVHRPVNEMIMGLEGWLPIYMTGQMSSYYLPRPTNEVFLHFIRSAGTVAVLGEAIAGNQGGGRYIVTKNSGDVAYARRRAEELLAHAKPLIRVWGEDARDDLDRVLRRLERKAQHEPRNVGADTFKNMTVTVWPGSHALIEKDHSPRMYLLVEHPALVDALERYEPTLF